MRFSIIVPVYNVMEYLRECVDSLTGQAFSNYEILLIDDGSTDESGDLCDTLQKEHPDIIRVIHQKNGGLGAARNTGIEEAKGEYLLFVDSDDYLRTDSLQVLDRKLRQSDADMVIFSFTYLWSDHTLPGEPSSLAGMDGVTLAAHPELLMQAPSTWLRVYHHSLFENPALRFPDRVWFEDLRTTAKTLVRCRSISVISEPLYFYRQREGSILHNPNLRRNLEILEAMDDLLGYFKEQGLMETYRPWLEILAVENMILASQRVLMRDPNADFLPQFTDYLNRNFPGCEQGEKLGYLGKKKRLVLRLLQKRRYRLLRQIFNFRSRMRGEK